MAQLTGRNSLRGMIEHISAQATLFITLEAQNYPVPTYLELMMVNPAHFMRFFT
jgi:hypothetical protein